MKKILLISPGRAHQLLYGKGLEKLFKVQVCSAIPEQLTAFDAIVYDMPKAHEKLEWIANLKIPVVILTSTNCLLFPKLSTPVKVLTYPVVVKKLLEVLGELGINP